MKHTRYIYGLQRIRSGKFFYIGQTGNPKKRESCHASLFNVPFRFVILTKAETPGGAGRLETKWIRHFQSLKHPLVNKRGGCAINYRYRAPALHFKHTIQLTRKQETLARRYAKKDSYRSAGWWISSMLWRILD